MMDKEIAVLANRVRCITPHKTHEENKESHAQIWFQGTVIGVALIIAEAFN